MTIPVLSPELMESQLKRYQERLSKATAPEERVALQGRIQAIELFLDNCVMETLSGVVHELKIDSALFDIPFLAKALGVGTEQIPKQLSLDWNKNSGMTPEEIEAKKASDPMFKAAMERKGYCEVNGQVVELGSKSVTETDEGTITVEETIRINTDSKAGQTAINALQKKWSGPLFLERKDFDNFKKVTKSEGTLDALYEAIINKIDRDKAPAYRGFIEMLKSNMRVDKHPIRAFLLAKSKLKDWTDEEIANLLRFHAAELGEEAYTCINPSGRLISSLTGDETLFSLLSDHYQNVAAWEKQDENASIEVVYPIKDFKTDVKGRAIQISRLYDLISPARHEALKKRYVEKGVF